MATYAIGDIQGCYDALRRLLDKIDFDPAHDNLWFVGDLVNRGPKSLATLRFIRELGASARIVLGNHDLHLLAIAAGNRRHLKKGNLDAVLRAPDCGDLLNWLRGRPLMHFDAGLGFALVHAGLPPQWDLPQALACAREVQTALGGPDAADYLHALYGDEPARWSEDLAGMDRLRFITNCFTRLRYCRADGTLVLAEKASPGSQAPGLFPWYALPNRASRGVPILFGHWSSLGYAASHDTWCLDTGCVWKGRLTAVRIAADHSPEPIAVSCD